VLDFSTHAPSGEAEQQDSSGCLIGCCLIINLIISLTALRPSLGQALVDNAVCGRLQQQAQQQRSTRHAVSQAMV
jgi:hypothetical protein